MENEKNLVLFPEELRRKAIALFPLAKPKRQSDIFWDIIIKLVKGRWELIKPTGVALSTPALVLTRGEEADKTPYFSMQKELEACIIKADIENIKADIFNLRVTLVDKEKNLPLKRVDIKLVDLTQKRKLEEVVCDGQTTFEGLSTGIYDSVDLL